MKFREFRLGHDEKYGWVITHHSDNRGTPRLRELEEAGLVTCSFDEGVWVWHLTRKGEAAMREEYLHKHRSGGRGGRHPRKRWYRRVEPTSGGETRTWIYPSFEAPKPQEGDPGDDLEISDEEYSRLLRRRRNQVRDALNRCSDLEAVERAARALDAWVPDPDEEIILD